MTRGTAARAGMLVDGRVVDAWAALGEPHRGSLRELIEHGRIDDLRARIGDTGAPSHPLSAVRLLPPIPDPEKIICIGLNYAKHAEEGRQEPADDADHVRQVAQRPGRRRGDRDPPRGERRKSTTRPRSPSSSAAARTTSPKPTRSTSSPATPSSTTSPPATSSSPRRSGWRARSSTARRPAGPALVTPDEAGAARRDRDRADPERREDAGRLDRELHLRRPAPGLLPLRADDARARGHRRHRHPGRASAAPANRASGSATATSWWSARRPSAG